MKHKAEYICSSCGRSHNGVATVPNGDGTFAHECAHCGIVHICRLVTAPIKSEPVEIDWAIRGKVRANNDN